MLHKMLSLQLLEARRGELADKEEIDFGAVWPLIWCPMRKMAPQMGHLGGLSGLHPSRVRNFPICVQPFKDSILGPPQRGLHRHTMIQMQKNTSHIQSVSFKAQLQQSSFFHKSYAEPLLQPEHYALCTHGADWAKRWIRHRNHIKTFFTFQN